ncbi:hypothetical protein U9M48_011811 [Paspalum notatum var. saurae]|uniref:Uncharacterized protein n=1 Tax=Paspalum notatum var. saurae TaxID=547442 RepID=A0AAQ3WHG0_PASNO
MPTVWYADTGERLGTYRGHNGAVWTCDVFRDDQTAKLWDLGTGRELFSFRLKRIAEDIDDRECLPQHPMAALRSCVVEWLECYFGCQISLRAAIISVDCSDLQNMTRPSLITGSSVALCYTGKLLKESDKESGYLKTISSLSRSLNKESGICSALGCKYSNSDQDMPRSNLLMLLTSLLLIILTVLSKTLLFVLDSARTFGPINAFAFNPDGCCGFSWDYFFRLFLGP